jgi:hypothetical protein
MGAIDEFVNARREGGRPRRHPSPVRKHFLPDALQGGPRINPGRNYTISAVRTPAASSTGSLPNTLSRDHR